MTRESPPSWKYSEFARTDPFSPPAWRWQRAGRLASTPRSPTRWVDDALTWTAVGLLNWRAGHATRQPPPAALVKATTLFEENGQARWAVEAMLLAGLSDKAIGTRCGIPVGVVRLYEAVFFDVRVRLTASDWIAIHTFGGLNSTLRDTGCLWRWAGYTLGEPGLDAVRAATNGEGRNKLPQELVETVELLIELKRLPDLPERRFQQLHLRLLADRTGRPAAAYHVPRTPRGVEVGTRRASPPALSSRERLGKL